ncbi:TAXI family TRAP transporter solute-binding subunit [Planctomycetota bacterium]
MVGSGRETPHDHDLQTDQRNPQRQGWPRRVANLLWTGSHRTVLAIALLLTLLGSRAEAYDLTLATGPKGGTYDELGRAIGKVVTQRGQIINLAVLGSPGSVGNLRLLESGSTQLAFVQGDILLAAARGEGPFPRPLSSVRALANLYQESLHVVAAKESGIESIADLKGKRVCLGADGSGTRATAGKVLVAHEVQLSDLKEVHTLEPRDAEKALGEGTIDAFFLVAAVPSGSVDRALKSGKARLVPIDEDAIEPLESSGAIGLDEIYPEDYGELLDDVVPCAVVSAVLCARADVPPDVVYEIMILIFQQIALAMPEREDEEGDEAAEEDGDEDAGEGEQPKQADGTPRTAMAAFAAIDELTPDEAQAVTHALHPGAVRFYYEKNVIERPVKVFTGFFIKEIYHFDMASESFNITGGIWFRWRGRLEGEDPEFGFRLTNGVINSQELREIEYFGGWTYIYYEIDAEMRGTFNLEAYPFDSQTLKIEIEHGRLDTEQLVFVADENIDGTSRDLMQSLATKTVADWHVASVAHETKPDTPGTDLGNPLADERTKSWSRYTLRIELTRLLLPYLLKFSVPLVLIGVMTFSVFFIDPEAYESKLLLVIWDLFIAVEYHTFQSETLPEIGYLVVADKFFLTSYVAIVLVLVHTIALDYYFRKENHRVVNIMFVAAMFLFPLIFFGPIGLLTWAHL